MKTLLIFILLSSTALAQQQPVPTAPRSTQDILGDEESDVIETDQEPLPQIKQLPQPITDQKGGNKQIYHPNARKGLRFISKEKVYYYQLKKPEQTKAASLRFGSYTPTLKNNKTGKTFNDIYGNTTPIYLMFDYEWLMWRSFGKGALKAGTGLFLANGKGTFETSTREAREHFTFVMLPLSAGVVYRFQFWEKQPIVPYVEGAGDVFGIAELRDDKVPPKFGGAFGFHVSAGASLSLAPLSKASMLELSQEYGITNIWLTIEVRQFVGLSTLDFTGTVFNGGFLAEF